MQQHQKMARRSNATVLYVFCLLLVVTVLTLSFYFQHPAEHVRPVAPSLNLEDDEDATVQGEYLLGVGKADITG